MDPDLIRQVAPEDIQDETIEEQWLRETSDQATRGVEAWKPYGDSWRVVIWVAEFVRSEPLESELFRAIESALRSVQGVTEVEHEDREQWIAAGTPSGEALVRAAAEAVDVLADRTRRAYEG